MFYREPQYASNPHFAPPHRTPAVAAVAPSLDSSIHDAHLRTHHLEERLRALEQQIAAHKHDLNKHRPGTVGYNAAKRRALQALRQRKALEARLESAANAQFNMEQMRDAQLAQRDNIATVAGMTAGSSDLRKANQQIDMERVEDMQDEVEGALEDVAQVHEALGRQYDDGTIDASELQAELQELEDDALDFVTADVMHEAPAVIPQHRSTQAHAHHAHYHRPNQQGHPAYANQGAKY